MTKSLTVEEVVAIANCARTTMDELLPNHNYKVYSEEFLHRMGSDEEIYAEHEVLLDLLEQQAYNIDFNFLNLKI